MAFSLLLNYRDPNKNKKENFAKPVVDIAASSRTLIWLDWLARWGCSLTDIFLLWRGGGGGSLNVDLCPNF